MRAISLWQPWASLIVLGEKEYETRGWSTGYRGPLLIHAAKRIVLKELEDVLDCPYMQEALFPYRALSALVPPHRTLLTAKAAREVLPFGKLIGTVDLVDCIPTEIARGKIDNKEYMFGNYGANRYAWRMANPFMFDEPIEYKGEQGFFEVFNTVIVGQLLK